MSRTGLIYSRVNRNWFLDGNEIPFETGLKLYGLFNRYRRLTAEERASDGA